MVVCAHCDITQRLTSRLKIDVIVRDGCLPICAFSLCWHLVQSVHLNLGSQYLQTVRCFVSGHRQRLNSRISIHKFFFMLRLMFDQLQMICGHQVHGREKGALVKLSTDLAHNEV